MGVIHTYMTLGTMASSYLHTMIQVVTFLQGCYQTMCKQADQLNLLDHYRSQASVNN